MVAPSSNSLIAGKKRIAFALPSFEIDGSHRLTILSKIDRQVLVPELVLFDRSGGLADLVPDNIEVRI